MKIIHIADINYSRSEGIRTVLENLIPEQIKGGNEVFLLNLYENEHKARYELYVRDYKAFKKTIERISPEVVIFHSLYKWQYISFSLYLMHCNIPYLIEPHGGTTILNHKKSSAIKTIADVLFFNYIIKKAAGIVYLNSAEKEQCVFKKKRKGICVIPNGVLLQKVDSSLREQNRTIKFIYLSRIDFAQKAIDYLLEAWNLFYRNNNAELHIYGGCSDMCVQKRFEELLSESCNVFYHGDVRGEAKMKAYTEADIFILTSRYEGMPMAIMEALSFGLPCLITSNTNMDGLIVENECGWVCNLSVEDIVNTMTVAVKEYPIRALDLSERAKNSVLPFQWSRIAGHSIEEYSRVIGE